MHLKFMKMHRFQYWCNCPHCPDKWGNFVDDTDTVSVTCANPACAKHIEPELDKIKSAYLDYLHKQVSVYQAPQQSKHSEKLYKLPNGNVRLFSTRLGSLFKQFEHAFGLTEINATKGD